MIRIQRSSRSGRAAMAALFLGGMVQLGFIENCDDRLATFSQFVDPCGTILSNCVPGQLQVNAADVPDFCIDPSCTVPGQCGSQPVLGTVTDLCP